MHIWRATIGAHTIFHHKFYLNWKIKMVDRINKKSLENNISGGKEMSERRGGGIILNEYSNTTHVYKFEICIHVLCNIILVCIYVCCPQYNNSV